MNRVFIFPNGKARISFKGWGGSEAIADYRGNGENGTFIINSLHGPIAFYYVQDEKEMNNILKEEV